MRDRDGEGERDEGAVDYSEIYTAWTLQSWRAWAYEWDVDRGNVESLDCRSHGKLA